MKEKLMNARGAIVTVMGITWKEIRKKASGIITIFILVLIFAGCAGSSSSPEPKETKQTVQPTALITFPTIDLDDLQTIPIVTEQEEESSFEKYGIRMYDTDKSSCFSAIGYDYDDDILQVTFRDSGVSYQYSDVPVSVWNDLKSASSPGKYYNSDIKGNYSCTRMD